MATYPGVELSGSVEVGTCDHGGVELLVKNTGLEVADIAPVVGSKITPFAEVYVTITEVNPDG